MRVLSLFDGISCGMLALERERSVASAQNEIVSLAMEAAEKVLGREMDEEANRAIVDAFLDEEEEKEPNSEFAGTHVGAVNEAPAKEPAKRTARKTSAPKTAAVEEKPAAPKRRGRPKKTN